MAAAPQEFSSPTVAVSSPPSPAQEQEEDNAVWASFGSETLAPTAKADTDPENGAAARQVLGEESARNREKRRLWRIAVILAIPLALVVAVLLWQFVLFQPGPRVTVRLPLAVAKDGSKNFKSIRSALHEAKPGDIIEIHDEVIEENVVIDKAVANHVTLQAPPGKTVLWFSATKKDEKNPVLFFSKASGFRLKGKGITLDGDLEARRKVDDLVFITSYCPGLILEDLELRGFGKNAMHIMNAEGEGKNPIRIHNLSINGSNDKTLTGIYFDINLSVSPQYNDWIEINDACVFPDMPAANAIKMKDNTVNNKNVVFPKSK